MATQSLTRLLSKPKTLTSLISSRFFVSAAATTSASSSTAARSRSALLGYLRPLSASVRSFELGGPSFRGLSTDAEPSAPAEDQAKKDDKDKDKADEIILDGCDFQHWLVIMEKPEGDPTRDEIIDSYIKTLAMVMGSEDEARMKIYSVSTRCYYAFSFLGDKELSEKINDLPKVRWVVPDSYLDVKNKDYGGEPFIDGKAVPYDPKYHKEWMRNNKANSQPVNKGPARRDFDQSRNSRRSPNQGPRN